MITISVPFDMNIFTESLKEFKAEKSSGSYAESINFEVEVILLFWNQIEEQIKQHFENKGMDDSQIDAAVQKALDKIKYSPAGYSINKFGLGEFLKNAAEPGLDVKKLNFVIALDETKSSLDPQGVIVMVMDNGKGYPKEYLDKDTEKKQGMANMRVVKDPKYIEGKIENKDEVIERKKTVSNKAEIQGSLGGKGIGLEELAKTVTISEAKNPTKVLGRMLIGNVEDLKKTAFTSLLSEDFELPKQGAVTILYSPYYSKELMQACEDSLSTRYKDFITNLNLADKVEEEQDWNESSSFEALSIEQNSDREALFVPTIKVEEDIEVSLELPSNEVKEEEEEEEQDLELSVIKEGNESVEDLSTTLPKLNVKQNQKITIPTTPKISSIRQASTPILQDLSVPKSPQTPHTPFFNQGTQLFSSRSTKKQVKEDQDNEVDHLRRKKP